MERRLMTLMGHLLNGTTPPSLSLTEEQWRRLFYEATAHEIHLPILPLCLPHIYDNGHKSLADDLAIAFKKATLANKARLIPALHLAKAFDAAKLDVLFLKGFYFRHLYPNPDTRTMGDVDVYVHPKDMARADALLLKCGYDALEESHSPLHRTYHHPDGVEVELHFSLIRGDVLPEAFPFNDHIWQAAEHRMLGDTPCLVPSVTDHALYGLIHMLNHLKTGGFGYRQLLDFALLIHRCSDAMDWGRFFERTRDYAIYNFAGILLTILEEDFHLPLPETATANLGPGNDAYKGLLLKELAHSGVFGDKDPEYKVNRALALKSRSSWLGLLFPAPHLMMRHYPYLTKKPWLLPYTWLHRLVKNLTRRDLHSEEKMPRLRDIQDRNDLLTYIEGD